MCIIQSLIKVYNYILAPNIALKVCIILEKSQMFLKRMLSLCRLDHSNALYKGTDIPSYTRRL